MHLATDQRSRFKVSKRSSWAKQTLEPPSEFKIKLCIEETAILFLIMKMNFIE